MTIRRKVIPLQGASPRPTSLAPFRANERSSQCFVIVEAIVGNQGGEAFFEGRGPWRQLTAQAPAHQRNLLGVDARLLQQKIDHRRDYLLPVRTKDQAFAMHWPELPRAVEGQHIVAALHGRA